MTHRRLYVEGKEWSEPIQARKGLVSQQVFCLHSAVPEKQREPVGDKKGN
jgi:hypothetical protein